tara:strand:- start:664 stop:4830 length:4167 start_codon:yes stop_codon:yes gene_type:complete
MKRILGLDLGTNSIGWALVNEAENEKEISKIIKLGVRVNPLTIDEKTNFEKGRPLSTNADRTLKRGARRNLQRYKLRRENLIEILIDNHIITKETPLTEIGKGTTYQTLSLRAKAVRERIDLEDFAKVLLAINKKRGYKSSRKASNDEEGRAIDGMAIAKELYERGITPGQYVLELLENDRKYIPDFYRSDLKQEFNKIWNNQKTFYPEILTDELFKELDGKNKSQTWAICQKPFNIKGIKRITKGREKTIENYHWRVKGLSGKLNLEKLAIILQEINNDINQSSGYLGGISDKSKKLYLNKETVGEFLYKQIAKNPHTSLKNQVFYRHDYLDEFEQIWKTQSNFNANLTDELKQEIRDVIIFYQRKIKSQKSLISFCQFESWEQEYFDKETGKTKTRTVGRRVIPKSSPLFQEFKIWQNLNHLVFTNSETDEKIEIKEVEQEIRKELFEELNLRGDLNPNDLLKILRSQFKIGKLSNWKCNFEKIEGNRTNAALFNIYQKISDFEGYGIDWNKSNAKKIRKELKATFPEIGIDASILEFDAYKKQLTNQSSYELWHLLYSAEEDFKISEQDKLIYGNSSVSLKKKLHLKFGFNPEYAKMLANLSLMSDYGNLSAKAIKKILPYLEDGHLYSEACRLAGYNHSKSLTAEELEKFEPKAKLDLLKKNSLRNPVVEKILNQMVNVVNQVIDTYGKPDGVRIELARELKKSAKERAEMTKGIADGTRRNEEIKKIITQKFGIPNPTKSDLVRYRLWQELESRGYKDIFTDKYISPDKIFSSEIDIEHIIPKALLFDDSFSNKTLSFRNVNLKKANRTALDFITQDYQSNVEAYKERVETWNKDNHISKGKRNKLLMSLKDIPDGFIERDLRNSQYIARKAKRMLYEVFPNEVLATSGSITDKLRSDWDLINVMKELNLPKYKALGLTEYEERLDKGTEELFKHEVIKDWTKRNDHRHHAMDALAVAFTTHNHIQYINNLNARKDITQDNHPIIKNIENLITEVNSKGKRVFKAPMSSFRESAKEQIEAILVSFKNKNKVVTKNINQTKKEGGFNYQNAKTPRGQLHKETIYGKSKQPLEKPVKINNRFCKKQVGLIINFKEQEAVLHHLKKYDNNEKIAFSNKTLKSDPIQVNGSPLREVKIFEEIFTIRKDINPDNFKTQKHLDKIIDKGIKEVMKKRLEEYNGDFKTAFSDLDKNPIWLNQSKGITIKRATISGVTNAEPLHQAKDHLGNIILDDNGKEIPIDYVSTGNNHHVAIYQDESGNLQEEVVSFYEAVIRKNQDQPIIKKRHPKGWKFLFTMKQNEMFVFSSENFNPSEIDLLDEKNAAIISPNLFRVQKIATKNYMFRHHLETEVTNNLDFTYRHFQATEWLRNLCKVRIDHIGRIVQIGEY